MPRAPAHPLHPPHEEFYHLVILDPSRTRIVAGVSEEVWKLPYVRSLAHQRQWPAIERQLGMLGLVATPIHEAYFRRGAASFVGTGWHHYVALDAHASAIRNPVFAWHAVDRLLARRSLFPIAEDGLRACLARLQRGPQLLPPEAPFDGPEQVMDAHAWVQARLSDLGATIARLPVPRRMGRFDTILCFRTTMGLVTFKGGAGRTAREAQLVDALGALRPRHFPRVVATSPDGSWWLTTAAGSRDPNDRHDPSRDRDLSARGVTFLADVQRAVLDSDALELVRDRPFGGVQFDETIARLRRMLARGPFHTNWAPRRITAVTTTLLRAADRLVAAPLPWTWTPTTFTLPNLEHDGSIGFEDVEESVYAPPTLAFCSFVDDLWLRGQATQPIVRRLEQRYIDAWHGAIDADVLRRAMADSHLVAPLLAFHAHADRLARADGISPDDPLGTEHPALAEHAHLLGTRLPLTLRSPNRLVTLIGGLPLYSAPDWEGSRP